MQQMPVTAQQTQGATAHAGQRTTPSRNLADIVDDEIPLSVIDEEIPPLDIVEIADDDTPLAMTVVNPLLSAATGVGVSVGTLTTVASAATGIATGKLTAIGGTAAANSWWIAAGKKKKEEEEETEEEIEVIVQADEDSNLLGADGIPLSIIDRHKKR